MYPEYEKMLRMLDQFKDKHILVIGDVMLDKYVWGNVSRISPEAPVQIVDVSRESFVPGGASNVANNVTSLGGVVHLVGVTGNDEGRDCLIELLIEKGISPDSLIADPARPTTMKVRVMGGNQQLIRADYEKREHLSLGILEKVRNRIDDIRDEIDCIVVSDYAKGVVSAELMEYLRSLSEEKNIPLVVDPKPRNKEAYRGATLVTPNAKEVFDMLQGEEDIHVAGRRLSEYLGAPLIVTRGEKGMSLFSPEGIKDIPNRATEVFDVCGAGDTVVAALALSLCSGAGLEEAAIIANHAAGIVVKKVGVATCSHDEVLQSLIDEEKGIIS